jgi:3-oxoacyl-[acyl-carrier protein] reductase
MRELSGKIAIVTGGSRGIGRAIAERLAHDGATVVINYVQHADKAQEVVNALEAAGAHTRAVQADMSHVTDIRRLFQETINLFGQLDIVVNNAAITLHKLVAEMGEEEFDAIFNLNAKGTFFALQEAARHITDGGRIVNISSGSILQSFPGNAAYEGSKAAVVQFTRVLAKELGKRNITVNAVSPGPTETEMAQEANAPGWDDLMKQRTPLGRLGQPEDIADVVAFVVSEQSRWITGQNIHASGGIV